MIKSSQRKTINANRFVLMPKHIYINTYTNECEGNIETLLNGTMCMYFVYYSLYLCLEVNNF